MAKGEGAGGAELCPGLLWSFIWLLVLIFVAWPLAGFVAGIYILLLPFGVCIAPLKDVNQALLTVINFPYQCSESIVNMTAMC